MSRFEAISTTGPASSSTAVRDVCCTPARGPLYAVGIWLARLLVATVVVLSPLYCLQLVASISFRLITVNTAKPLLVVLVVAVSVATAGVGLLVFARHPLRRAAQLLELGEVLPTSASVDKTWWQHIRRPRLPERRLLLLGLGETTIYAMLVATLFWPINRLDKGLLSSPGDGQGWAWIGWRVSREMAKGSIFPRHLVDAMHPYSINLIGGDGYMTSWIAGVLNLVVKPALAYNLTQVVAVVLAIVAGRVLARTCTKDRVAILLSTAAFATAPLVMARFVGHQNLIFVFPAALVMSEIVRILRSEFTRVRLPQLTLWLVLAYLSSIYYLLFGLMVLGVAVAYCLIRRRFDRSCIAPGLRVLGACALTLLCIAPFVMARFGRDGDELAAGAPALAADTYRTLAYSADLYSLVSPPPDSLNPLLRFAGPDRDLETTVYPGVLLLVGLGGLLLVRSRLRTTILVSAVALWVLSLGPSLLVFRVNSNGGWSKLSMLGGESFAWLPYTLLLRVPGLASLRTPVRSGFWLVPLGAAALAVVLGAVLHGRSRWIRSAVAVVGLLIVIGDMPANVPFISGQPSPTIVSSFDQIAKDNSNRAVLVVPDDCLLTWGTSLFEVQHLHPVVGCTWYSSSIRWYSGIDQYTESEAWASIRCAPTLFGTRTIEMQSDDGLPDPGDLVELADELQVGWIVLDKAPTQCNPERFAAIDSLLRTNATLISEDSAYAIFELPSP